MNTIFHTYAEFTCTRCGNKLWSKDEQEIMDFIQLYDAEKLICPVCGNNKFKVAIRGNGGRGVSSSASPPPVFQHNRPLPPLKPRYNEESMEKVVDEIIRIARRMKK